MANEWNYLVTILNTEIINEEGLVWIAVWYVDYGLMDVEEQEEEGGEQGTRSFLLLTGSIISWSNKTTTKSHSRPSSPKKGKLVTRGSLA